MSHCAYLWHSASANRLLGFDVKTGWEHIKTSQNYSPHLLHPSLGVTQDMRVVSIPRYPAWSGASLQWSIPCSCLGRGGLGRGDVSSLPRRGPARAAQQALPPQSSATAGPPPPAPNCPPPAGAATCCHASELQHRLMAPRGSDPGCFGPPNSAVGPPTACLQQQAKVGTRAHQQT